MPNVCLLFNSLLLAVLFAVHEGKSSFQCILLKKVCPKRKAAERRSGLGTQEARGANSFGRKGRGERERREGHRKRGQDGRNVGKETEKT